MTLTVWASAGIGIGTAVCVREQNPGLYLRSLFRAEREKPGCAAADLFTQRTQAMADDITNRLGEAEAAILTGSDHDAGRPFMLSPDGRGHRRRQVRRGGPGHRLPGPLSPFSG